jgi:hypothetical protein
MTDPDITEAAARAMWREEWGAAAWPPAEDPEGAGAYRALARAAFPVIEAAVLEKAATALAPFARAADVYHEERFAPSDEITGRFGKIVRAEELWCLRNLYTRLRARAKHAPKAQGSGDA